MDHFGRLHRVRSCVSLQRLVEFDPLLVCRVGVEWLDTIVRRDCCVHSAVGGVAKVPLGCSPIWLYFSPVAVTSRTNDFNFHVPRIGLSSAMAIVEDRSSIGAVKAARLFMTTPVGG